MSSVETYLASVPQGRRERIEHMMSVIQSAQPEYTPRLWDSGSGVIGFGTYHFEYPSGRTGEWLQLGIANRARYISLYVNCDEEVGSIAVKFQDRLPTCKIGKSCIEVPDSATVDDAVLADLTRAVANSFQEAMRKPKEPDTIHIWE